MSQRDAEALVLTYHAIDEERSPLSVEPSVFGEHVELIAAAGRPVVTVSGLADRLQRHDLGGAVAITFDDGFASVVEHAVPILLEHGLTATIFCVAAGLGGWNDWPTDRVHGPRRRLADVPQLAEAAAAGIEIGSHGLTHAPLLIDDEELLWHELEGGRAALEVAVERPITAFAYPYGVASATARALAASVYASACTTELRPVRLHDTAHSIPRVDAHYLRSPALLTRALDGSLDLYLRARRLGSRARRRLRPDYRLAGAAT